MPADIAAAGRLHYEMVRGLLERGACPANRELAASLDLSAGALAETMAALAALHGVVLHPHVAEPWIVHPFSLTPTLNFVEAPRARDAAASRGWWAPCVWCAFGIAVLAGGEVAIHTRWAAETTPLVLRVKDGEPDSDSAGLPVHFAIPPARAWDNVHRHCSLVLPFRSAADIAPWCARHHQPQGEAVPLRQVALLARLWYGEHARSDWRKWTVAEAQAIFSAAGLRSAFWNLGEQTGRY
jgi:hypothetical protein